MHRRSEHRSRILWPCQGVVSEPITQTPRATFATDQPTERDFAQWRGKEIRARSKWGFPLPSCGYSSQLVCNIFCCFWRRVKVIICDNLDPSLFAMTKEIMFPIINFSYIYSVSRSAWWPSSFLCGKYLGILCWNLEYTCPKFGPIFILYECLICPEFVATFILLCCPEFMCYYQCSGFWI